MGFLQLLWYNMVVHGFQCLTTVVENMVWLAMVQLLPNMIMSWPFQGAFQLKHKCPLALGNEIPGVRQGTDDKNTWLHKKTSLLLLRYKGTFTTQGRCNYFNFLQSNIYQR